MRLKIKSFVLLVLLALLAFDPSAVVGGKEETIS
jgi:hypothetical protein